jgi:hypothetical protein
MKLSAERPFAKPETAVRKLMMTANAIEPAQDGRIFIELLNGAFLFTEGGTPQEYGAALPTRSTTAGCGNMNPGPM